METFNFQPAFDRLVRQKLDQLAGDADYEVGLRRGLEHLTHLMFSEAGIKRAAAAYEARADLPPLDRMQWAMAAAINATEYIIE